MNELLGQWGTQILPGAILAIGAVGSLAYWWPSIKGTIWRVDPLEAKHDQTNTLAKAESYFATRNEPGDTEAAAQLRVMVNQVYNPQGGKA